GPVLPLLQESVARHALGSLLSRDGTQKPVVDSQRFGLVLRIDQQIKQHAVVHRRAIGLVDARVQIAQRLCRFLVLRRFIQHGEIRFDRVLDAILLKEALGAIQMLVDVSGHSFELPLRPLLLLNSWNRALREVRAAISHYIPLIGSAQNPSQAALRYASREWIAGRHKSSKGKEATPT